DHVHERDGRALAFVTGMIPCPLTTFIMSYALARGLLAAGLAVTAAMALGMIVTIGGIALAAAFALGNQPARASDRPSASSQRGADDRATWRGPTPPAGSPLRPPPRGAVCLSSEARRHRESWSARRCPIA